MLVVATHREIERARPGGLSFASSAGIRERAMRSILAIGNMLACVAGE